LLSLVKAVQDGRDFRELTMIKDYNIRGRKLKEGPRPFEDFRTWTKRKMKSETKHSGEKA
jgi:hypothetical protein